MLHLLQRYALEREGLEERRGTIGALSVSLFAGFGAFSVVNFRSGTTTEGALWVSVALSAIIASSSRQRPSNFEAALAIPGRTLLLARVITTCWRSTLPVVAGLLVFISAGVPVSPIVAIQAVALALLLAALPSLVRTAELSVNHAATMLPMLGAAAAGALAIYLLPPVVTLTVTLAAVAATAAALWIVAPATFVVASGTGPIPVPNAGSVGATRRSAKAFWWMPVARSLPSRFMTMVLVMLLFGGATHNWMLFVLSLPVTVLELLRQRTRWMHTFPMSHRSRLWMVLGPGAVLPLVFVLVGMAIPVPGLHFVNRMDARAPTTYRQEPRYVANPTRVSLEYWKAVPASGVPMIMAPWGETVMPYTVRMPGSLYYNPFSSRLASSKQFERWQFERLTTRVYGHAIALETYRSLETYPPRLANSLRLWILYLGTAISAMLFYVLLMELTRWHRVRGYRALEWLMGSMMILPVLLWIIVDFRSVVLQHATGSVLVPWLQGRLMALADVLPARSFIVFAVAAIPVVLLYALLERQFRLSELVGTPIKT